jgi:photosystem II stability/assembly factor-like uncharacterized protein
LKNFTIVAATVGSGMFYSHDGGETIEQSLMKIPVAPWSPWVSSRSVAVSPHNPHHFLAGTDAGVHLSEDGGKTWEFLNSPADRMQVWSTVWHPTEPDTILIGLAPFKTDMAILRSRDRGKTWENLHFPLEGQSGYGATHVTHIGFDPKDSRTIWAGVEIGGLWKSADDGKTWNKTNDLGPPEPGLSANIHEDVHSFAIGPEGNLYIATPKGVQVSYDEGQTFSKHEFKPFALRSADAVPRKVVSYCRGAAVKPDDPNTVFLALGEYTPGRAGAIFRSKDKGKTWEQCDLPVPPNSHVYSVAVHPDIPNVVAGASIYGYIYVSEDGGDTWRKASRELGEIRGLAVAPN